MKLSSNSELLSYIETIDNCNESIKACKEIISNMKNNPNGKSKITTYIDSQKFDTELSSESSIQLYEFLMDYYRNSINNCTKKLHSLIDKCSKEED